MVYIHNPVNEALFIIWTWCLLEFLSLINPVTNSIYRDVAGVWGVGERQVLETLEVWRLAAIFGFPAFFLFGGGRSCQGFLDGATVLSPFFDGFLRWRWWARTTVGQEKKMSYVQKSKNILSLKIQPFLNIIYTTCRIFFCFTLQPPKQLPAPSNSPQPSDSTTIAPPTHGTRTWHGW